MQRRHQKVVEEAPAPQFSAERRQAMGAAARAADYVGAGTVEFVVAPDGAFYFMEMNTRLQVEHPATEMITGLDLVEWQLRIAAGEPLPLRQEKIAMRGHALGVGIYAERPEKGFLPSAGILTTFKLQAAQEFVNGPDGQPAIRVDSGFRQGDTVTPFYDALLAKLILRGRDRNEAIALMLKALEGVKAEGVHTNARFLHRLIDCESFRSGNVDTGLIARELAELNKAAA